MLLQTVGAFGRLLALWQRIVDTNGLRYGLLQFTAIIYDNKSSIRHHDILSGAKQEASSVFEVGH